MTRHEVDALLDFLLDVRPRMKAAAQRGCDGDDAGDVEAFAAGTDELRTLYRQTLATLARLAELVDSVPAVADELVVMLNALSGPESWLSMWERVLLEVPA